LAQTIVYCVSVELHSSFGGLEDYFIATPSVEDDIMFLEFFHNFPSWHAVRLTLNNVDVATMINGQAPVCKLEFWPLEFLYVKVFLSRSPFE